LGPRGEGGDREKQDQIATGADEADTNDNRTTLATLCFTAHGFPRPEIGIADNAGCLDIFEAHG
jgi:hypothetical protein